MFQEELPMFQEALKNKLGDQQPMSKEPARFPWAGMQGLTASTCRFGCCCLSECSPPCHNSMPASSINLTYSIPDGSRLPYSMRASSMHLTCSHRAVQDVLARAIQYTPYSILHTVYSRHPDAISHAACLTAL